MGKTPWIGDQLRWQALPLIEKLELLRKHYCTGPCGQSSAVMATRSATNETLLEATQVVRLYNAIKPEFTSLGDVRQQLTDQLRREEAAEWGE